MAKSKSITTPSVLSFARVLEPTDCYLYQRDSKDEDVNAIKPVVIEQRAIRTTKSHRFSPAITKNEDKYSKEASDSNIQLTQTAYLDEDCDTLVAKVSLKVLPFNGSPEACNNLEYQQKLMQIVEDYSAQTGFDELSERYATNIANGRWLWRNRYVAKGAVIHVVAKTDDDTHTFTFDAKNLSLREPNASAEDYQVGKLASLIADALLGKHFLVIDIEAHVDIGYGHQVFPSEEMNQAELSKDDERSRSKKQLFSIKGVAGMHAVKIGNALRTIDTWFNSYEAYGHPISAEVYGAVTRIAQAFRVSKSDGKDFYSLLDGWLESDLTPTLDDQHYVMAVLIRGGVFGKAKDS